MWFVPALPPVHSPKFVVVVGDPIVAIGYNYTGYAQEQHCCVVFVDVSDESSPRETVGVNWINKIEHSGCFSRNGRATLVISKGIIVCVLEITFGGGFCCRQNTPTVLGSEPICIGVGDNRIVTTTCVSIDVYEPNSTGLRLLRRMSTTGINYCNITSVSFALGQKCVVFGSRDSPTPVGLVIRMWVFGACDQEIITIRQGHELLSANGNVVATKVRDPDGCYMSCTYIGKCGSVFHFPSGGAKLFDYGLFGPVVFPGTPIVSVKHPCGTTKGNAC